MNVNAERNAAKKVLGITDLVDEIDFELAYMQVGVRPTTAERFHAEAIVAILGYWRLIELLPLARAEIVALRAAKARNNP